MPPVKLIKIGARSIDEAADKVIELLQDTSKGNVMCFDGWYGLGASAVLRAVAKRVRPSSGAAGRTKTGNSWDKVIHVDCSVWQSKRALQKAIAQELELPWSLMSMFDQHDEDDDFSGVEQSARGVISEVTGAIFSILGNRTFLVIFHNGSNGYIDLVECGVPVIAGLVSKMVLWTSRSRFRIVSIEEVSEEDRDNLVGLSDVAIYAYPTEDNPDVEKFLAVLMPEEAAYPTEDYEVEFLPMPMHEEAAYPTEDYEVEILAMPMHEEAEEVARYTGVPQSAGMSTELVKKCILYQLMLRQQHVDYTQHWDTHAANYWVCSGIIQTSDTSSSTCHSWSAWEIAQALYNILVLDFLTTDGYSSDPVFADLIHKALRVPSDFVDESSFFWTCDVAGNNKVHTTTVCHRYQSLEARMFQHPSASKLRVIHLFECTFSFASPPFLSCSSLRFLLLDHCKDQNNSKPDSTLTTTTDTRDITRACFRKLWVLDMSCTDWYWLLSAKALDLMVNLRELNVKGIKHWSISHLHCDDNNSSTCVRSSTKPPGLLKLVKLQVGTNPPITEDQHQSPPVQDMLQATLSPNLSSCETLKTIILDGCFELKRIGPADQLPPSLESFTFSSSSNDNVQVSAKIESISFQGCTKLKSVCLIGLFESLTQLDISGTCIKTLDLRAMRGNWSLQKLFLLGCKELHAILWPTGVKSLDVLHMDTSSTKLGHAAGEAAASSLSPVGFKWYISLRDGRLLRSLNDIDCSLNEKIHIEISSPPASADGCELGGTIRKSRPTVIGGGEQPWTMRTKSRRQQGPAADNGKLYGDVSFNVQQHLQLQATMHGDWSSTTHYISLQDERMPHLPGRICERASSLHVHDSLSIASITSHSTQAGEWNYLEQCRVERCPNIEGVVFTPPEWRLQSGTIFFWLRIFWASQLAKAQCIWDWGTRGQLRFQLDEGTFGDLRVLHLDSCPRLRHVLPLNYKKNSSACRRLEILEILSCGDLKDVFPVNDNQELLEPRKFPKLKHIHLHDLPSLQRICGRRMVAPNLETVKIQGCWSLNSLPSTLGRRERSTPRPKVDCEKDWWDRLQWDGIDAGHDRTLYDPTHSRYYKNKDLPRGSVLR